MSATVVLMGVPIDGMTMGSAIERLAQLVEHGRQNSSSHQVATVNVDFLVNALSDSDVMALLQQAELNLADGMPLVWASRLLGTPLPERVAGSDLVPLLGELSEKRGWSVHLFGAAPGVADRARSIMLDRNPTAKITSDAGPEMGEIREVDESIVESIRAVDPDVLCVALGNPKQEQFIARYRDRLRCPVMIGIGGSLDMLVGDKQRAPRWAQRAGAEWIFRAAQDPIRLGRRYSHDARVFLPAITRYVLAVKRYRRSSSLSNEIDDSRMLIRGASRVTGNSRLRSIRCNGKLDSIDIDLDGVESLSPRAHASLVGIVRDGRFRGLPVLIRGMAPRLRDCFDDYGTWPLIVDFVER